MKQGLKTSLALFVIALICGALLAGVNYFTAPEIERAKSEKVAALLSEFYSQEDGYLFDEDTTSKKEKYINNIYLVKKDGVVVAHVYATSTYGYSGGELQMLVAIEKDGLTIKGMKLVQADADRLGGKFASILSGVEGTGLTEFEDNLVWNAGVTVSTKAVEDALKKVLKQASTLLG